MNDHDRGRSRQQRVALGRVAGSAAVRTAGAPTPFGRGSGLNCQRARGHRESGIAKREMSLQIRVPRSSISDCKTASGAHPTGRREGCSYIFSLFPALLSKWQPGVTRRGDKEGWQPGVTKSIGSFLMRSFRKEPLNYAASRRYGLSIRYVLMRFWIEGQDGAVSGLARLPDSGRSSMDEGGQAHFRDLSKVGKGPFGHTLPWRPGKASEKETRFC